MEFLVSMTTHVPDGTPPEKVDDVRAREAAHTRELAADGHILRLWRPPLRPGEWRTVGLFAATDAEDLGKVLASMPLHVWRADASTPLARHPNDPEGAATTADPEYFTLFTRTVPDGTPTEAVEAAEGQEAVRAAELGRQGHLLRLWMLPGEGRALGLWCAKDAADLQTYLDSLPLSPYQKVDVTPLTEHPSDPAIASR
jgi:muconolactone delta-isomerase